MNLLKASKINFLKNEPLSRHTTFRIGGQAEFFAEPKDATELADIVCAAQKRRMRLRIIGAGSNILASDKGLKGITVILNSPYFKKTACDGTRIKAGAGVVLGRLLDKARQNNLSGCEFLAGIPGTVGGAIAMNSGITENRKRLEIGDLVENISVMDYNGKIIKLRRKDIKFGYRESDLGGYIILGAELRLKRAKAPEIARLIKRRVIEKKQKQDYSAPSAGCVFKNPVGYSAGRLIDLCGLKGRRIGGAAISLKHANFILNLGRANFGDVRKLMALAEREVKKRFGVVLEPEIKIWQ